MQSKATTVEAYLASLSDERRFAIAAIREVILRNLNADFEEGMQYGMIGYFVPHRVYPAGYHCDPKQPLPFVGLASQKNYLSIYIMSLYNDSQQLKAFVEDWKKTGKKLDMGKCCIRFKRLEDVALEVIGKVIKNTTSAVLIQQYAKVIATSKSSKPKTAKVAKASKAFKATKAAKVKKAAKVTKAVKATKAVKGVKKSSSTKSVKRSTQRGSPKVSKKTN